MKTPVEVVRDTLIRELNGNALVAMGTVDDVKALAQTIVNDLHAGVRWHEPPVARGWDAPQWIASGSGPDHYAMAAALVTDLAGHLGSEVERDPVQHIPNALALAQVEATLAVAAAIAGLDATEGPAGGSTLGRHDAVDWEAVAR